MDKSGNDPNVNRLERIRSPFMTGQDIMRLYEHMLRNSELSPDSIIHQIESAMALIDRERFLFLSQDIEELHLSIEEISFLLEHNRYQEKECVDTTGGYQNIDVRGTFPGKHTSFSSQTLQNWYERPLNQSKTSYEPIVTGFSGSIPMFSQTSQKRVISVDCSILEHEASGCPDMSYRDEAARFVRDVVQNHMPRSPMKPCENSFSPPPPRVYRPWAL